MKMFLVLKSLNLNHGNLKSLIWRQMLLDYLTTSDISHYLVNICSLLLFESYSNQGLSNYLLIIIERTIKELSLLFIILGIPNKLTTKIPGIVEDLLVLAFIYIA